MYVGGIVAWFSLALLVGTARCDDLVLGSASGLLAEQARVQLPAVPFVRRVKNHFFSVPVNSTAAIKGLMATDLLSSSAVATITSGGVGATFVNIRLKSEKSKALDYSIQIFT